VRIKGFLQVAGNHSATNACVGSVRPDADLVHVSHVDENALVDYGAAEEVVTA
jgi:hypothetical protein